MQRGWFEDARGSALDARVDAGDSLPLKLQAFDARAERTFCHLSKETKQHLTVVSLVSL